MDASRRRACPRSTRPVLPDFDASPAQAAPLSTGEVATAELPAHTCAVSPCGIPPTNQSARVVRHRQTMDRILAAVVEDARHSAIFVCEEVVKRRPDNLAGGRTANVNIAST